jgi:hypothetical protein
VDGGTPAAELGDDAAIAKLDEGHAQPTGQPDISAVPGRAPSA